MKKGEQGFTIIEAIVVIGIISVIGLAASMTIFQSIKVTESNNNRMTVLRQVNNAGYWISRDAQMVESAVTDNLSSTDFIILNWTEHDYDDDDIYHSVTYFFEGLSGGMGTLKRNHWSSAGANGDTLVAQYISYDPTDPVNTSNVSYQKPELTVKFTALFEDAKETREYKISRRINYN